MAALLGGGARGRALAVKLVRSGVRTRAALLRSAAFAGLPAEIRASVRYRPVRSVPLAEARAVAAEVARRLEWAAGATVAAAVPVGSIRRGAPRIKDIDLLVVERAPALAPGLLRSARLRPARSGDVLGFVDTYASGPRHRALIVRRATGAAAPRHYRLDLFAATAAEEPFALYHYTGSREYNIRTRALAKKKGWRLNQYGLFRVADGRPVAGAARIRTEADLAAFLGVSWREPSRR